MPKAKPKAMPKPKPKMSMSLQRVQLGIPRREISKYSTKFLASPKKNSCATHPLVAGLEPLSRHRPVLLQPGVHPVRPVEE